MDFFLMAVVTGILATAVMTFFLWIVNKTGLANADMVRALGSGITRSYDKAMAPGMILHFVAGIIFAMIYIVILNLIHLTSTFYIILTGGIIGFWHGFAFSFVMVILAEHHPVERFKDASFQVAIVHFAAHIIYGLTAGIILALSGHF
ncbi:MAG: hypothetical protein WAN36_12760 [Calditrichia bacterium]